MLVCTVPVVVTRLVEVVIRVVMCVFVANGYLMLADRRKRGVIARLLRLADDL